MGCGLLAVSADRVWALISLLRKGSVLWEKGRVGVPLQDYASERRFRVIFSRLSTQSDSVWTMMYVTSNCVALVAILLLMAFLHCMVRYGSARQPYGTVRLSSGRFAFPLQFSTAIEWAGLFTRRYNCAASTAVTSS